VQENRGIVTFAGLVFGAAIVVWAHVSMGGSVATFAQVEALAVVFGGTAAALMVSFPTRALRSAWSGVGDLFRDQQVPLESMVPTFINFARKAKRHGLAAIERDLEGSQDPFLVRAVSLSLAGLPADVVREALEIDARVLAEREEERAQVLEAAAGYAPTLGIVGAVLGLMRVMQTFGASPNFGAGIAAAFVATILGVGAANLAFLPLATRLRARARQEQLRRELMIDGVLALRDGASPGVLEERLAGYLTLKRPASSYAEVA
jgi:chemotaxis protein MotA